MRREVPPRKQLSLSSRREQALSILGTSGEMSLINYRLISFLHGWVLLAEGVPVERFNSKRAGMQAAELKLKAANRRHDKATLTIQLSPTPRHVVPPRSQ
jgi:hypothetical protein